MAVMLVSKTEVLEGIVLPTFSPTERLVVGTDTALSLQK